MQFDRKELTEHGTVQFTTEDERWYWKQESAKWYYSVTWITSYRPKGKGFEIFLKKYGSEADEIRDLAAEKGSKVHQAIAQLLATGEVNYNDTFLNSFNGLYEEMNAQEYKAFLDFVVWLKTSGARVLLSESVVFNEDLNYAGTLDLIVEMPVERVEIVEDEKGKPKKQKSYPIERWIIDVKTSKNVYPSHRIQVEAYRHCFPDQKHEDIPLHAGILQVGYITKQGWKLTEVEDCWNEFLATYTIFRSEVGNQAPYQVEYPLTIKRDELWDGTIPESRPNSSTSAKATSSANEKIPPPAKKR